MVPDGLVFEGAFADCFRTQSRRGTAGKGGRLHCAVGRRLNIGKLRCEVRAAGTLAITTHVGAYNTLPTAYAHIFPRLMTLRGYRVIGLPAVEIYHNDARFRSSHVSQTDLCLPVTPRVREPGGRASTQQLHAFCRGVASESSMLRSTHADASPAFTENAPLCDKVAERQAERTPVAPARFDDTQRCAPNITVFSSRQAQGPGCC